MEGLRLPKDMKNNLDDFARRLKDIYKDGLVSLILYGSAASGEFLKLNSNINLAVVLDDARLSNLARISRIINERKFKPFNVIFFTEDYMRRSIDVFPIEFLDMKENHAVLYGKDILNGLAVDTRNLRFQCEHELKSNILQIKKAYLRAKNRVILRDLLFRSLTSAIHILRNLVRLKGKEPSYAKEAVLKALGREFNIDTAGFEKILEAKINNLPLSHSQTESLFFDFVTGLEKIAEAVDRI